MKNPTDWSEGFGCGAMFVAIVYTIALAFLLKVDRVDFPAYATIWAGALALLGAWITVRGIRDQNQTAINIHQEGVENKLAAARAILPLLLAEVTEVAAQNVRRNFPESAFVIGAEVSREFKEVDWATIDRLKDYAPLFPPEISARIGKILATYQVMKSRDSGRENTLINDHVSFAYGEHNAIDSALNWSVIHSLTDTLYPYARGVGATRLPPIDAQEVESAMLSAGVVSSDNAKVRRLIKSREEKGELEINFSKRYQVIHDQQPISAARGTSD